jgi:hypothetical protein
MRLRGRTQREVESEKSATSEEWEEEQAVYRGEQSRDELAWKGF